MNEQLLTINNITKICDDNYYIKSDDSLTEIQWYDHQLDFIIANLDVDVNLSIINPVTDYRLSRSQIYKFLKNKFKTTEFTIKSDVSVEELKKNGVFRSENQMLDTYIYDNLGGYSDPKIEYNYKTSSTSIPNKYIYGKLVNLSDFTGLGIVPEIEPTKKLSKPKIKLDRYPSNTRSTKGSSFIKKTDDPFLKMGKFDWCNNSCYADAVLLSLMYNAIHNKENLLYVKIMNFNYDDSLITKIHQCSNNVEGSRELLNKILNLLKTLLVEIEAGKIIRVYGLLKLMNKCDGFFTQNFSDGLFHDANEFLRNIFKLLHLSTSNSNIKNTYVANYKNIDEITVNVPDISNGSYNMMLTDGLGNELFDVKKVTRTESEIQSVNITSQMLVDEYINSGIDTVSILLVNSEPKKYMLDILLKKYVLRSNKLTNLLKYNDIEINLSKFMLTRIVHEFKSDKQYYYRDDDIVDIVPPYDLNHRYYYKTGNKGKYDEYSKSSEMPESVGFRVAYLIEELILGNTSEYITFNINRKYLFNTFRNKQKTVRKLINIKVVPDEILNIDSSTYKLTSIVMYYDRHYVAIILINNVYYLYDDAFKEPMTNYTQVIGEYADIKALTYGGISNIALRNSTNVFYSKI